MPQTIPSFLCPRSQTQLACMTLSLPVVMKFLEWLVTKHIKASLPAHLDTLWFAYRANQLTKDTISTTLYLTMSHLERKNTNARRLFIDVSFNTIIPQQLVVKLKLLGVNADSCNWILSQRRQSIRVGSCTSGTISVSTGSELCFEPNVHSANSWLQCQIGMTRQQWLTTAMTQQWSVSLLAITTSTTSPQMLTNKGVGEWLQKVQ